MIYLIIETDLSNMMHNVSAYSNKAEFEKHKKLCDQCLEHIGDTMSIYRYQTKIIQFSRSKKQLVKNMTDYGIKDTIRILKEFKEQQKVNRFYIPTN